jgi:hypothetical protein
MTEIQTPAEGTEPVEEPTITTPPAVETPAPTVEEQLAASEAARVKAEEEAEEYRTKFGASTTENQIAQDRLKQFESQRESNNDPTEAELRAVFPSWDIYTDSEKELARGQLHTRRMSESAVRSQKDRDAKEKFDRELEIAIASNPSLEGKERAFKEFANKPTHRGASTDVLVDAFLHRSGAVTTPRRDPTPGLEPGSGGPKEPAKPKELSAGDLKKLRETNYDAYLEYVKTHDIKLDI